MFYLQNVELHTHTHTKAFQCLFSKIIIISIVCHDYVGFSLQDWQLQHLNIPQNMSCLDVCTSDIFLSFFFLVEIAPNLQSNLMTKCHTWSCKNLAKGTSFLAKCQKWKTVASNLISHSSHLANSTDNKFTC